MFQPCQACLIAKLVGPPLTLFNPQKYVQSLQVGDIRLMILTVKNVSQMKSSLLFAKLVGPPLTLFNPPKYVQSWLTSGRHSADNTNSKKRVTDEINQAVWKLL